MNTDYTAFPSPCYVLNEEKLIKNLEILNSVSARTGAKILLAQKAFSMYSVYPIIEKYLNGTTASSLHELRLGKQEMKGEAHIFAPAYRENEFTEIVKYADHIVFNSPAQYKRFANIIKKSKKTIECGIRINPEYSEIKTDIYNPCFKGSRLGTTARYLTQRDLEEIDGLHFHTMCEQGADVLERTLRAVEKKFGNYLYKMKWLNFGGGHHITRDDYDIDKLISCIIYMRDKYDLQIYLEPGEAVVLNAGVLCASVLDTMKNDSDIAILDVSAECHMPDVIEMPYRPEIIGAGKPDEKPYTYRLGGPTCLAGDIIGDYSFDTPLTPGDRLVFCDMALYTMVKNNTFNGINLPSIGILHTDGRAEVIKTFGYKDFKNRL